MIGLGLGINNLKGIPGRYSIEGVTPLSVWDAANQIARSGGDAIPLQTLFANTRNGTATYVDAAGAIVTQPANLTRTNAFIGGVSHALFEPAGTNFYTYSSDLTNAVWGSLRTDFSTGAAAPVSGEAFLLGEASETNSNGSTVAVFVLSRAAGTYTQSVHVDPQTSGGGWMCIRPTDNGSFNDRAQAWFDIGNAATGTVSAEGSNFSAATSGIEVLPDGTLRCWITYTISSTTNVSGRYYICDGDNTLTVTLGKKLSLWGANLVESAFLTSYIPAVAIAVTRLADAASCALTTLPVDTTGGTIFVEGRAYYDAAGSATPIIFRIDDGTVNNHVSLAIDESGDNLVYSVMAGGVLQASEAMSYTSGAAFIAAIRFVGNDCILSLGGANSIADTSVTLPSGLDTFRWGQDSAGAHGSAVKAISKFRSFGYEFTTAEMDAETGA